jgi:hypothetical protein
MLVLSAALLRSGKNRTCCRLIFKSAEVLCYEGEHVFSVLQRTCQQNGFPIEFENTPMYNSAYIEGSPTCTSMTAATAWPMYCGNDWF